MSAVDELRRLYPGHYDPELLLFVRDPLTKAIITKPPLVSALNGPRNPSTISNSDCLRIADKGVPEGALQLIRFRAREPNKAHPASTRETEVGTLISLFDKLNFPISSVLFARRSPRVEFSRLLGHPGDSDERPIFYVTGSRMCLVWSPEMKSRSTVGVLVNFTPEEYQLAIHFAKVLEAVLQPYGACFGHPMLLPLVLVQLVQADTMVSYAPDSQTLRQIEHRLTVKAASRIDTMQRLRDLGRITVKDRFVLSALIKVMEFCLQVEEYYSDENATNEAKQLSKTFHWHARQRLNLLELDVRFLENISESVSNQQASISTIINMQDGASMKTLAIITMLFLPATFVASLFAMPMFEWNNDPGQVVSRHFWIYWAVAVPLTLAILLAWLGWWYWHNVRKHYDNPQSTSLADALAWLRDTFGASTKQANYQKPRPIDRLGPLYSDGIRKFEDDFYDFEYEEGKRASKIDLNPFPETGPLFNPGSV